MKRPLIIFLFLAPILLLIGYVYFTQIVPVLKYADLAKNDWPYNKFPQMYQIADQRSVSDSSTFQPAKTKEFSTEFARVIFPWEESFALLPTGWVSIGQGKFFNLRSEKGGGTFEAISSELTRILGAERNFKEVFPGIESEFDFQQLMYTTTPDTIKPLMSERKARALYNLLKIKSQLLATPEFYQNHHGIWVFEADNVRGFQFGNPEQDKDIAFVLFDEKGQMYGMNVDNATQREIDFILASFVFIN